jgi:small subunit ribosomal protein S7
MSKTKKTSEIKLLNKWDFDVKIHDFSLERYINLKPIIIPQTHGRHEHKRFWKSNISIIERFINKLQSPGFISGKVKGHKSSYNSGKKNKLIKFVETAFSLIELKTGMNPLQVLINAIENAAPREETTKIAMGGISYASAVDIAPQRRVDLALKLLVQAIVSVSHDNIITIEESIAQELIAASKNSQNSKAIKRKDEIERIAVSAR